MIRRLSPPFWPERRSLPEGASAEQILVAYGPEIARVQSRGSHPTVDAIRLTPDHPDRETLRRSFLAEHTHAEDAVRFFDNPEGWVAQFTGDPIADRFAWLDELLVA